MLSPGYEQYEDNPEYSYEPTDDEPQAEPVVTWQDHARAATAPKSAFQNNRYKDKIVELYGRKGQSDNGTHIMLTSPKDVNSSNIVTDAVKDGKICAVNLTGVDREQCQRIVDVIAGAIYALEGSIQRVSKDIFIVAPDGVTITGEMKEELSKGFPWAFSK
jgi:FtsZ-interacting cell division protein YlmF